MVYEQRITLDLHIHSDASDGSFSPAEILSLASEFEASIISITDHDTGAGSIRAIAAGIPQSVEFITGVEISAAFPSFYPGNGSIHILGYGFDPHDVEFNRKLTLLQDAREQRNPLIIQKLADLGIDISLERVKNNSQTDQVGRPHIAQFLVDRKIVSSIDEAFDSYLGHGKAGYVEKKRIAYHQALDMIIAAGGIPVLAHPFLISSSPEAPSIENLVQHSIPLGLKGIETFYPEHTPAETAYCLELARKYNLLITGGTDFHGEVRPGVQIGIGAGDFSVPYHYIVDFLCAVRQSSGSF